MTRCLSVNDSCLDRQLLVRGCNLSRVFEVSVVRRWKHRWHPELQFDRSLHGHGAVRVEVASRAEHGVGAKERAICRL